VRAGELAALFGANSPGLAQRAQANTLSGGTAAVTATLAATPRQTDLLVATFTAITPWGNTVPPAGWTAVGHQDRGTGSSVQMLYKVAGAAESASLTMQHNSQLVSLTGTPTGGTFKLADGANVTAAIAFNATSGAMSTALTNAGITGWSVTGGSGTGVWTLTRSDNSALKSLLTLNTNSLTGGTAPSVAITRSTIVQQFLNVLEFGLLPSAALDQSATTDGGAATVTSLHHTSITPTGAPGIVVACSGLGSSPASTFSWSEGFTVVPGSSTADRNSTAWKAQAVGAAVDPTATWTTAQLAAGVIASFK
jgi:hypothetical protein